MKLKELNKGKMWCYISPSGYIQTRTIMTTKKLSRDNVPSGYNEDITYKNYEDEGFELKRIVVTIKEAK